MPLFLLSSRMMSSFPAPSLAQSPFRMMMSWTSRLRTWMICHWLLSTSTLSLVVSLAKPQVSHSPFQPQNILTDLALASTKVTEAPKTKAGISAPPRYHPSLSGKFLASGPPPPCHLRPSAAGKPSKPKSSKPKSTKPKISAAAKKRTFIESDDEDDFVVHSSYSRNKRARVEDSDDEADDDFVLDHPSTPKSQPKPKKVKKVKKPSTSKKNIRPTTSGKQLLTTAKHPSEHIRPALRELPPRPTVQPHRNKKNSRWIKYEHDCLYFLIVQQRNKEVCGDLNIRPLMDMNLFALMSEQLKSFGIVRTDGGARNYWNRYGRFKVQWDERIDTWAGRDLITCAQESKAGNSA